MKPQQIAYIQLGSFSNANHYIVHSLRKHFPNHEIDVIDIGAQLRAQKTIRLLNLFFTIKEYGKEIVLGRRKIRECMYLTSYLFKKMSDWSAAAMAQKEYAFSIQTQSMFDASRADLDHFVYTDHTVLAHLRYPHLKHKHAYVASKAWLALEGALYRNAAANFTMSKFIEESLCEDYACPREKVVCARAGANTSVDNPVLIAKYTRKEILFVGVRWERKGGPELLKAFKQVLIKHPDARLTIVGCEPMIAPVIAQNCRVLGRVDTDEVTRLYNEASLFCLPSMLEPFGFVFIEAMMHRLPVVATNIGAIPDFLEDGINGYMVEPGNVDALATALINLLDSPEKCMRFGEKAHQTVAERYTWDATIATIKEKIVQVTKKSIHERALISTQVGGLENEVSHRRSSDSSSCLPITHRRAHPLSDDAETNDTDELTHEELTHKEVTHEEEPI